MADDAARAHEDQRPHWLPLAEARQAPPRPVFRALQVSRLGHGDPRGEMKAGAALSQQRERGCRAAALPERDDQTRAPLLVHPASQPAYQHDARSAERATASRACLPRRRRLAVATPLAVDRRLCFEWKRRSREKSPPHTVFGAKISSRPRSVWFRRLGGLLEGSRGALAALLGKRATCICPRRSHEPIDASAIHRPVRPELFAL